MKIVKIFTIILVTVAGDFRQMNSWGLPELENIVNSSAKYMNPKIMQCLNVAYNHFLNGLKDFKDSLPVIQNEELKAVVPSPQGHNTWTVEDLKNAAILLMDTYGMSSQENARPRSHESTPLTLQEVRDVLEIITPTSGKPRNTVELININILNTLNSIMEEGTENTTKKGYKVEMPIVDVSIWTAEEVHRALNMPGINPKVIPYLKQALIEPTRFLDDGETFCLVTPIHVLPATSGDYYIPKATKRLLSKIRTNNMRKLW